MKGAVIIPRQGRDFRVEAGEHHIEVSVGSSFNELYWDFPVSRFVTEPEMYEDLREVLRHHGASWLLALIPQLATGNIELSSEQLRELASKPSAPRKRTHSRFKVLVFALVATILALWVAAIITANFGIEFNLPRLL